MNNTDLQDLCETYINGNITDAKRQAKHFDQYEIEECLVTDFGYSDRKARLTAAHMNGADCWQEACDAK